MIAALEIHFFLFIQISPVAALPQCKMPMYQTRSLGINTGRPHIINAGTSWASSGMKW